MTDRLAMVPSLDQVAAQPALVQDLPHLALKAMMFQAMKIQEACFTALLTAERGEPTMPEPDRLLTAKDAAPMLGISAITLLRNRHRAPYRDFVVQTGTRRPGFSLHRIQQHIELHAGSAAPARRSGRGGAASAAPSPARLIGG